MAGVIGPSAHNLLLPRARHLLSVFASRVLTTDGHPSPTFSGGAWSCQGGLHVLDTVFYFSPIIVLFFSISPPDSCAMYIAMCRHLIWEQRKMAYQK